MTSISAEAVLDSLPGVLETVLRGEEVVIVRDGAAVAKLVAMEPLVKKGFGGARGRIRMLDDFDAPIPDFADYEPTDNAPTEQERL